MITARRAAWLASARIAVLAGAAGFARFMAVAPKSTAGAGTGTAAAGIPGGTPTELAAVASISENGGVVLEEQKPMVTRESGDKVHCFQRSARTRAAWSQR